MGQTSEIMMSLKTIVHRGKRDYQNRTQANEDLYYQINDISAIEIKV